MVIVRDLMYTLDFRAKLRPDGVVVVVSGLLGGETRNCTEITYLSRGLLLEKGFDYY